MLLEDFRRLHEEIFAVRDEHSAVEVVALRARVVCPLESRSEGRLTSAPQGLEAERETYFSGHGRSRARVLSLDVLAPGQRLAGPAIVESPLTTVVLEPGTVAERRPGVGLVIAFAPQDGEEGVGRRVDALSG
jgi:N-methylhydantoinase A